MASFCCETLTSFSRMLVSLLCPGASVFIGLATASANFMPVQSDRTESRTASGNVAAPGIFPDPWMNADESSPNANQVKLLDDFAALNEVGRSSTGSSPSASKDLRLSDHQHKIIAGAPGSTISLDLRNFVLSGHSTLSLLGTATSTFIFNVTKRFSLSQSARIILSSGLQWSHVFFNVLGAGSPVSLEGRSVLFGILTADQRTVRLNGHAMAYGEVFARKVIIRKAAQIITPPIVSP